MLSKQMISTLFPYTTLFRSKPDRPRPPWTRHRRRVRVPPRGRAAPVHAGDGVPAAARPRRSEEHTSELQSHVNLVYSLLLEKKNYFQKYTNPMQAGS